MVIKGSAGEKIDWLRNKLDRQINRLRGKIDQLRRSDRLKRKIDEWKREIRPRYQTGSQCQTQTTKCIPPPPRTDIQNPDRTGPLRIYTPLGDRLTHESNPQLFSRAHKSASPFPRDRWIGLSEKESREKTRFRILSLILDSMPRARARRLERWKFPG